MTILLICAIVIILMLALLCIIALKVSDDDESNQKRSTSRFKPCSWNDGITQDQFRHMANIACKYVKRLDSMQVAGAVVLGTVRAQSGLSKWDFRLDFNDHGHVTGRYSIYSENEDSIIPKHIAENLKSMIEAGPEEFFREEPGSADSGRTTNKTIRICPSCGEILNNQVGFESWMVAFTCKRCGFYSEWASDNSNSNDFNNYNRKDDGGPKSSDSNAAKDCGEKDLEYEPFQSQFMRKAKLAFSIVAVGLILVLGSIVAFFIDEKVNGIAIGVDSQDYSDIKYEDLYNQLKEKGFIFVSTNVIHDLSYKDVEKKDTIQSISVDGEELSSSTHKYSRFARITIYYHAAERIQVPLSSKEAKGMEYAEVVTSLKNAGFGSIEISIDYDVYAGVFASAGTVKEIQIDGDSKFDAGSYYYVDVPIVITYHEKASLKPDDN